jgi:galactokinase
VTFEQLFGRPPTVVGRAPGRVNLIGEHTDYNGGFVLPIAIPQRTQVQLAPREDTAVRVWSEHAGGDGIAGYALGAERPGRGWLDYVQGVTRVLGDSGHRVRGFDARIESTVPAGSGLSSSAALEIALLRALDGVFSLGLDAVAMARVGQRAENDFVGAPVGIMDQMACRLAGTSHALFIDTRSLAWERIALPRAGELVVIDSGVTHAHAGGDYRRRRDECARAAALLGVPALRDLAFHELARAAALPPPLDRRARHVVTENARVLAAVGALRAGEAKALGALFAASHASMRDDFEMSVAEIDLLVRLAADEPAVFGARLTGGGFGGAVVMLASRGAGAACAARIARAYAARSGRAPTVLLPPTAGMLLEADSDDVHTERYIP